MYANWTLAPQFKVSFVKLTHHQRAGSSGIMLQQFVSTPAKLQSALLKQHDSGTKQDHEACNDGVNLSADKSANRRYSATKFLTWRRRILMENEACGLASQVDIRKVACQFYSPPEAAVRTKEIQSISPVLNTNSRPTPPRS